MGLDITVDRHRDHKLHELFSLRNSYEVNKFVWIAALNGQEDTDLSPFNGRDSGSFTYSFNIDNAQAILSHINDCLKHNVFSTYDRDKLESAAQHFQELIDTDQDGDTYLYSACG